MTFCAVPFFFYSQDITCHTWGASFVMKDRVFCRVQINRPLDTTQQHSTHTHTPCTLPGQTAEQKQRTTQHLLDGHILSYCCSWSTSDKTIRNKENKERRPCIYLLFVLTMRAEVCNDVQNGRGDGHVSMRVFLVLILKKRAQAFIGREAGEAANASSV